MVQTGRSTETEVRLNCTVLCDIELCNWFNIVLQENFFSPLFLRITDDWKGVVVIVRS
jgi:hypothetical protein